MIVTVIYENAVKRRIAKNKLHNLERLRTIMKKTISNIIYILVLIFGTISEYFCIKDMYKGVYDIATIFTSICVMICMLCPLIAIKRQNSKQKVKNEE